MQAVVPPLFMFGFERSGTTLLSMMVGAHPSIAVPFSPTGLWYRYGRSLDKYDNLETHEALERIVDDLLTEERIRLWDVQLSRDEALERLETGSYPAIVARFHELYARHCGKRHWASIDIATLYEMDQAYRWFPNARFLHIVRDGRDVALSHETYMYGVSTTLECAEKWRQDLWANMKMGSMLDSNQYMVVRYEDLVLNTEATLSDICTFFWLSYSADMLNYPEMVKNKVPRHRRSLWPALDKPPVKSKVYRWKSDMSDYKRIVFEGVANDMLKRLGYEAYATVPKSLFGYLYELWCFLGRGGRMQRLFRGSSRG